MANFLENNCQHFREKEELESELAHVRQQKDRNEENFERERESMKKEMERKEQVTKLIYPTF
jgi:serine phosphatase RsbU (regulator of sigma subunit)